MLTAPSRQTSVRYAGELPALTLPTSSDPTCPRQATSLEPVNDLRLLPEQRRPFAGRQSNQPATSNAGLRTVDFDFPRRGLTHTHAPHKTITVLPSFHLLHYPVSFFTPAQIAPWPPFATHPLPCEQRSSGPVRRPSPLRLRRRGSPPPLQCVILTRALRSRQMTCPRKSTT